MRAHPGAGSSRGVAFLVLSAFLASSFPAASQDETTTAVLRRIRAAAETRSSVMETAEHLCGAIGPRLTGSPEAWKAAHWACDRLKALGLDGVHIESWGPFGRGWGVEHVAVRMLRPKVMPLIAVPKGWTIGTRGQVRGRARVATLLTTKDLTRERGRLRGAIVLLSEGRAAPKPEPPRPTLRRLSDTDLAELARPLPPPPVDPAEHHRRASFQRRLARFLADEHVLAVVESGQREGGSVLVARNYDLLALHRDAGVPALAMAREHFDRVTQLVTSGADVELELDVRTRFRASNGLSPNVVAELTGSDLEDEIVMIGAHLDSWHGATGATDNAAGVAVALEALRLLEAAGARPRRTIRLGLWTGEEQGLLGARAYVERHLGARQEPQDEVLRDVPFFLRPFAGRLRIRPAHKSFVVYFNLDYGTGRIRGVYLEGNDAAAPLVTSWLAPLHDLGVTTVSPRSLLGSDHQAFESVGLPAFPFIHDDIEYTARTHHTTEDVFERLLREDLQQASIVAACLLYQAAQADERPPRPALSPHLR